MNAQFLAEINYLKKYNLFWILIVLISLFISIFYLKTISKKSNYQVIKGEIIKEESSDPPFIEPSYAPIFNALKAKIDDKDSDLFRSNSENYFDEYPELINTFKDFKFTSEIDLFRAFRSIGKFNDESEAIKTFIENDSDNKNENSNELIEYFYETFLVSIKESVNQKQFDKALWLSKQLIERLEIIDSDPLNSLNSSAQAKMNEMYLTIALTSSDLDCFLIKGELKSLIPFYSENKKKVLLPKFDLKFSKNPYFLDEAV